MKNCEGCPYFDEQVAGLRLVELTRERIINLTAGAALTFKEMELGLDDPVPDKADPVAINEAYLARAEAGRADMVEVMAKVPKLRKEHFFSLGQVDEIETETAENIERAQATCHGPVPAIGRLIGECAMVCSADVLE